MAFASPGANQVELVVHGVTKAHSQACSRQAAVDQVGAVLDLLQLALDDADQAVTSAAAKLAMTASSDQMPSAGFRSGAYAGSRYTRSQASFASANSASSGARWMLRSSQTQTSGAASCRGAAMIRSR